MAKAAKKKVAKRSARSTGDHETRRNTVIKLLLRKSGATMRELVEAGHNQPAATALKLAQTRGLKTRIDKPEGDVTHYYATGTPTAPVRGGAKKKAAKKPAKKAAPKKKSKKR